MPQLQCFLTWLSGCDATLELYQKLWIYQGKLPSSHCLPQGPHTSREQYIQVALQWNPVDENHFETYKTESNQ